MREATTTREEPPVTTLEEAFVQQRRPSAAINIWFFFNFVNNLKNWICSFKKKKKKKQLPVSVPPQLVWLLIEQIPRMPYKVIFKVKIYYSKGCNAGTVGKWCLEAKTGGYSPWGCKELDTTEQLTLHFSTMSFHHSSEPLVFSLQKDTHLHIIGGGSWVP